MNRKIDDIILVDNAAYSFAFHLGFKFFCFISTCLANGIPIIPFYDDKNDKELLYLTDYLL